MSPHDSPSSPGPRVPAHEPSPAPIESRLVFTGTGSEYFRIWVVNTLLTLATLGIYSPWAKVRKTKYMYQNTQLDGFVFDYHARPIAILRGRILALVLFAAYTYSFAFSRSAGLVTVSILVALAPWLFMRAQIFKFANTSWRGMRFGFEARVPEAYRQVLPIVVLACPIVIGGTLFVSDPILQLSSQLPMLVIPWMHHRLKAYQHRRATFGDREFSFGPTLWRFYSAYLMAFFVMVFGLFLGLCGTMAVFTVLSEPADDPISPVAIFIGVLAVLLLIIAFSPYWATRLQQAVWSATRLGDIRFGTRIHAYVLSSLTMRCALLTLATLGLYWPFAAMRLAAYRIECMSVTSDSPLAAIAAGTRPAAVGATGDSAVDFFGFDVGL